MPEIKPFPQPKLDIPQGAHEVLPRLSSRGLLLGPSGSGKTLTVVRMIVDPEFYGKNVWSKVYIISPTASVDPAMDPVREFAKKNSKSRGGYQFY